MGYIHACIGRDVETKVVDSEVVLVQDGKLTREEENALLCRGRKAAAWRWQLSSIQAQERSLASQPSNSDDSAIDAFSP